MAALGSVLLVDDEETFRESTRRLLQREGLECHCAANGDDAVEALQQRWFDVMVTDVRMPGNPDLRVARAARERDIQLPVILVTGYPSVETAIRGIDLSVAAYMTKPLDIAELIGHVKSAIAHSHSRRALVAVRERLKTCIADLETAASQPPYQSDTDAAVSLGTIRTLAACLSELLSFSRPGRDGSHAHLCQLLDCPQQPVHYQAMLHTIEVLKQTKDAFKSKILADLRTQLEVLLEQTNRFEHRD